MSAAATRRNMRGGSQFDPWGRSPRVVPNEPPPKMEKPSRAPTPAPVKRPEPEVVVQESPPSTVSVPVEAKKKKKAERPKLKTDVVAPRRASVLHRPELHEPELPNRRPDVKIHSLKQKGPDANIIFVDKISLNWEPKGEEVVNAIRRHSAPSEHAAATGSRSERPLYGGQAPTHYDWRDNLVTH